MIFMLLSLLVAVSFGAGIGCILFSIFTITFALNIWCSLPIANISTLETFLEIYFILFAIFKKIWDNTRIKTAILLKRIFWIFAGGTGFITVLVAYEAFRYGIDSPKYVYTMVDCVPVLDWIENGIIQLWFWIYSFFNKIVQSVDNFVGGFY